MPLQQNLAAAQAAIAFVAAQNITSSNKAGHRIAAAGGIDEMIRLHKKIHHDDFANPAERAAALDQVFTATDGVQAVRAAPAVTWTAMANNAIAAGYGNCGELAAIAGVHMANAGNVPVHLMHFTAAGYDHMWAMIGLHAGWQPGNLRSWGTDAVWVDPWQHDDGVCFAMTDFIAGRVRNLNSIYKCDTVMRVEDGVAAAIRLA